MPTRLYSIVLDALDPAAVAEFWSEALGWPITSRDADEIGLDTPDAPADALQGLVVGRIPEPRQHKSRVHLDLASQSLQHQRDTVERLLASGATHADIGQGDVPWVVLADPEGNEFCVLEPRHVYADSGTLAAITIECPSPAAQASFWSEAAGWPVAYKEEGGIALRHVSGRGPYLELVESPASKQAKNRMHLDVAPSEGDDQRAEVARLRALGAIEVDIGQGDVSWVVLADPEGNEFCVLSPR